MPIKSSYRNFFLMGLVVLVGILYVAKDGIVRTYSGMGSQDQWIVTAIAFFFFFTYIAALIDLGFRKIILKEDGIYTKGLIRLGYKSFEEVNKVYFQKNIIQEFTRSRWLKKGEFVISSEYKNQDEARAFLAEKGLEVVG